MIRINISVGWLASEWFVSSAAMLSGAMHPDGGKTGGGKYKSRFLCHADPPARPRPAPLPLTTGGRNETSKWKACFWCCHQSTCRPLMRLLVLTLAQHHHRIRNIDETYFYLKYRLYNSQSMNINCIFL